MITTVRIAPVERWCEEAVEYVGFDHEKLPGREVQIYTHRTGRGTHCPGRWWVISNRSANEIRALVGREPIDDSDERGLCEHMLEMD